MWPASTQHASFFVRAGVVGTQRLRQRTCSSGCVTLALVKRRPVGRINRSYLGALRVKDGPTKVTFVTIRFHSFSAQLAAEGVSASCARFHPATQQRAGPGRTFPLPGLDDLEHLVLRDRGNLWQRHAPLASFLLPLLLDGVAQHLQPSALSGPAVALGARSRGSGIAPLLD